MDPEKDLKRRTFSPGGDGLFFLFLKVIASFFRVFPNSFVCFWKERGRTRVLLVFISAVKSADFQSCLELIFIYFPYLSKIKQNFNRGKFSVSLFRDIKTVSVRIKFIYVTYIII